MKIGILLLNGYNAISPECEDSHIGGAETQMVAIARGLVDQGHEVSFICMDMGQQDGVVLSDGWRIFKAFAAADGIPVLRFVWPRMTSVWAALGRADPDIFLQACADSWTGVVAQWCLRRHRAFVFFAMNDPDCELELPLLATRRERALARYGLRRANVIVAQTDNQQELLKTNFALSSRVVRPCSGGLRGEALTIGKSESAQLLWVGRFTPQKRLEWYLDAAEQLPDLRYHIVGNANQSNGESSSLEVRARSLQNVVFHGFIPHHEMQEIYSGCSVLVCTSRFEGFPTTFMEAWSLGIPTITTFDPDGLVARNGLGRVVNDVDELVEAIREFSSRGPSWESASQRAREFFQANHTVEVAVDALEPILKEALAMTRRGGLNVG